MVKEYSKLEIHISQDYHQNTGSFSRCCEGLKSSILASLVSSATAVCFAVLHIRINKQVHKHVLKISQIKFKAFLDEHFVLLSSERYGSFLSDEYVKCNTTLSDFFPFSHKVKIP